MAETLQPSQADRPTALDEAPSGLQNVPPCMVARTLDVPTSLSTDCAANLNNGQVDRKTKIEFGDPLPVEQLPKSSAFWNNRFRRGR